MNRATSGVVAVIIVLVTLVGAVVVLLSLFAFWPYKVAGPESENMSSISSDPALVTGSQQENVRINKIDSNNNNNNKNVSIGGLLINMADIELEGNEESPQQRHLKIHLIISNMNNESAKLNSNNFAIIQYSNQWYRQTTFTDPMELECTAQEEDNYYAKAVQAQQLVPGGGEEDKDGQRADIFTNSLVYVKCGVIYDPKSGSVYFAGGRDNVTMPHERKDLVKESGLRIVDNRVLVEQIPANSVIRVSISSPDIVPRAQNILMVSIAPESVSLKLGTFS